MAVGPIDTTPEIMAAVPRKLRERIFSGMRWTLWLSVLAVPFSNGTTILLSRAGPQVIGTYGLLMVYVGLVSSLFYLGGDPVTIKLIPDLQPEQRAPFLASYFLILLASLIPWLVVFLSMCLPALAPLRATRAKDQGKSWPGDLPIQVDEEFSAHEFSRNCGGSRWA
jgi:hypothetical protein